MSTDPELDRLDTLPYRRAPVDLWPAVASRIHASAVNHLSRRLLPIALLVLGWRALELFVDLPAPLLRPLVPLAAAIVAIWLIARDPSSGDPFAIETSAPELHKRGI